MSKGLDEKLAWKPWEKPGDWHLINRVQWGGAEVQALNQVLKSDWFGYGPVQQEAEKKFAQYTNIPHIYLSNSGSAAIEVGLLALKKLGRWRPGDKVIHPVSTFMTSISSAANLGMIPVFVENKPGTYVADPERVGLALEKYPDTRGMILPHLLGNIPDLDHITRVLGPHRFLLEDCCDTLGGTYAGKHIGSIGDIAAFSFYASHHITSGGVGGAVATKDKELAKVVRSLTFWGRDFRPGDDEFLKRYTYRTLGLDSQMSGPQAAFLGAQLDKLPDFVKARKDQFGQMTDLFSDYGLFDLPQVSPKADPSWFSYPLMVKESAPFDRSQFARYLTANKIEVRPVMCGNITRQSPLDGVEWLQGNGKGNGFPIGDEIEARALFVPCWGMPEKQRKHYYPILRKFLDENRR